MNFYYLPKTKLEKFGVKVFSLLVENFPQTFFVGGMVRDSLLHKKVTDIDIATEATPQETIKILGLGGITTDDKYKKFGVIIAKHENLSVEVITFRKDISSSSRYSKVHFVSDAKTDSQRRDFTINSLYLSANTHQILDFTKGAKDLNNEIIRFIGNPEKRIKEDPLRILRALRFSLVLNFKIEKKSLFEIKKHFDLIKNISGSRINKELDKILNKKLKLRLQKVIDNKKILDKQFK